MRGEGLCPVLTIESLCPVDVQLSASLRRDVSSLRRFSSAHTQLSVQTVVVVDLAVQLV